MTILRDRVGAVMETNWQPEGFTVPHATVYPHRWLWDSCFHVLIWAELGNIDRALTELHSVFAGQRRRGFVPHIWYPPSAPNPHESFWRQPEFSTLTQPPMYGHAVAELERRGVDVPGELRHRAVLGIKYLLAFRRHASGLIAVRHPWETGCDDSPRFDHWGAADPEGWYRVKGQLVRRHRTFDCAPVSLSALVAWNARELGVDDRGLAEAVRARWDRSLRTWVDGGAAQATSGRARTLEGLLPLLIDPRAEAFTDLVDPAAYGGPFGPAGVHRAEPFFAPRRYWRGPVWPQLAYLLSCAGADVTSSTVSGALSSGLAEYWDPDDGSGLGAIPQSWTGLALLMERRRRRTT